jgi:hypothetical protein
MSSEWDRSLEAAQVPVSERVPLTKEEASLLDSEWDRRSYATNLVDKSKEKAEQSGRAWQECLPEVCRETGKLPLPTQLLAAARGEELKEVVRSLEPLTKEWDEQDQARKELKENAKKGKKTGRKPKAKKNKNKQEGVPEPEELVAALESNSVSYLLKAGIKCWAVAFDRHAQSDKVVVLEAIKAMKAWINKFEEVYPS